MTTFARILIWIKSNRSAYYLSILAILGVDAVQGWRSFVMYYDILMAFTQNIVIASIMAAMALAVVLISYSVISIHKPKNTLIFILLCTIAVVHDFGGIYYMVYQNTIVAHGIGDFLGQVFEKPASAFIVIGLALLGGIPLTLSGLLEEWHKALEKEITEQHDKFITNASHEAERVVIVKVLRQIRKEKDLRVLAEVIEDQKMRDIIKVVSKSVKQLEAPKDEKEEENIIETTIEEPEDDIHIVEDDFEEEEENTASPLALPGVSRQGAKKNLLA